MKLSFVLCLSLATLSLAAIPSAKKKSSLSSSKKGEKDDGASRAASRSSQATKKLVKGGEKVPKKRLGVSATKGVASANAGKSSQEGSAAQDDCSKFALSFFPKVLVELIGGYLEGSFSVVFERKWSAFYNSDRVAVDSERYYLIALHDVQASSHSGGEQVSIGSPGLSAYGNFHSSHDGRSLLLTGKTKEQFSSNSSERITRWLVQDTGTKGLKSVALEGGESSFAGDGFKLSASGKTLLSMFFNSTLIAFTTSVYQIKEHGKAALASKKGDFDGFACAVSRNGNRIFLKCYEKGQLEIHDISGDGSHLVLKIDYAGTAFIGLCALNSDGSKAAFIDDDRKLYIVDVNKEKSSTSLDRLTPIGIQKSAIGYSLIYDAKDRLYTFGKGNLWLVDSSNSELVNLEAAEMPRGYEIQDSAISPNGNYIALLFQSKYGSEKGERQYQIVVKGDTKDVLMRLYGH